MSAKWEGREGGRGGWEGRGGSGGEGGRGGEGGEEGEGGRGEPIRLTALATQIFKSQAPSDPLEDADSEADMNLLHVQSKVQIVAEDHIALHAPSSQKFRSWDRTARAKGQTSALATVAMRVLSHQFGSTKRRQSSDVGSVG